MSQTEDFSETLARWAAQEPSVKALVLFGSRVRSSDDSIWRPDAQSDWDFQIVTANPRKYSDPAWLRELVGNRLQVYATRIPRLGGMPKINAAFAGTEVDFVILPSRVLKMAKFAVSIGLHKHSCRIHRKLQDLAIVLRPGYRFLKGSESWEKFYRRVVSEVPDPRLGDADIANMAEGFVYDYLWALRKIDRGELLAVQRMLHREMAETNFKLLHESKLRQRERSFPDARRLERIATSDELSLVRISSLVNATELRAAIELSADSLRKLVHSLVKDSWRWPNI